MAHWPCLVTACHQAAAVAASVRLHGASSAVLLCADHATALRHPDLPAWCEVYDVRPISEIHPAHAEDGVRS